MEDWQQNHEKKDRELKRRLVAYIEYKPSEWTWLRAGMLLAIATISNSLEELL